MLLIKNGRVVDPVNGVDKVMDVLVDGGQIVMTGDKAVDMSQVSKKEIAEAAEKYTVFWKYCLRQ